MDFAMPALETTEIAVESPNRANDSTLPSSSVPSLEHSIEQLKNFVRRQPQTSAGVLAYWLSSENR
jgi:hypothetical protein